MVLCGRGGSEERSPPALLPVESSLVIRSDGEERCKQAALETRGLMRDRQVIYHLALDEKGFVVVFKILFYFRD